MKLDRNINANGRGKYALLKLRRLDDTASGPFQEQPAEIQVALKVLERAGILDWGNTPESEFFVIRLKDKYAGAAMHAYAGAAVANDPEYAREIMEMAKRSGSNSPFCKAPD